MIIVNGKEVLPATVRLARANERLRRFVRETNMAAYKSRELAAIIKEITEIIIQIDDEIRDQVARAVTREVQ